MTLFPFPLVLSIFSLARQRTLHFFISANPFGILAAHHITLCSGVTSVMGCYRILFHLHCGLNHLINEFSASGNLFHFDGAPDAALSELVR